MSKFPDRYQLAHGELQFPIFLPDATQGVVRSLDAVDLLNCGIEAVVMNTFHLMQRPGSSTIQSLGGLHRMAGWERPIITDSGGFQAYSLIHQNPKFGQLSERGISFQPEGAERKYQLTPEKTVQLQIGYGADVVICLDDCTHVNASREEQELSVRRTVSWAKRGKAEFERILRQKKLPPEQQPKLFAVIQGGGYLDLRKQCADALLEIGFDGYGYGGWPLDESGQLLGEIIGFVRDSIPAEYPLHALGVGHPYNVLACYEMGYGIFDSAMPTRDARHGRLYAFTKPDSEPEAGLTGKWLDYVYVNDERNIKDAGPIDPFCDCLTCTRYSRGYVYHLFKTNDTLFFRLATIHNLRFMTRLTGRIRAREKAAAGGG